MFKSLFGVLQKIGRALMLPVAILPAAGILLALGNAMQNPQMTKVAPFFLNFPSLSQQAERCCSLRMVRLLSSADFAWHYQARAESLQPAGSQQEASAFLTNSTVQLVAKVMESSGDVVFTNLALLFAVGVAIGLANGDGVAGIAAIIGYLQDIR